MIPIYGEKRLDEIKKYYDAGEPLPFAGSHYYIIEVKYNTQMDSGSFEIRELISVEPERAADDGNHVRDAVLASL